MSGAMMIIVITGVISVIMFGTLFLLPVTCFSKLVATHKCILLSFTCFSRIFKRGGCQVLTGNWLFTSPYDHHRLSNRHSARLDSSTRLLATSHDRLTSNGNIQI